MNIKKFKPTIIMILCIIIIIASFSGCTEASKVSSNLSMEADNFNITRRLAVINARSDKPVFELIGNFSIETDSMDNQLEVTVEVSPNNYKKHFIYLNEWTMYVVEDVSGAFVDKYNYEINFLPEMIVPYTFTSVD